MTLDLSAIRKRLEAADPGPWFVKTHSGPGGGDDLPRESHTICGGDTDSIEGTRENVTLMAHAPEDMRALLSRVEELGAQWRTDAQEKEVNYLAARKQLAESEDHRVRLVSDLVNTDRRNERMAARIAELEAALLHSSMNQHAAACVCFRFGRESECDCHVAIASAALVGKV